MMFLYLLNMSGARSSIVSSIITPLLPYKCSGHGCACDLAGKELPGCACFGIEDETDDNLNDSNNCGPPVESCCSQKSDSKETQVKQNGPELDKVACDGILTDLYEMLDRHLNFETQIQIFYKEITYHISPVKLLANSTPNSIALGKVPIV